MTKQKVKYLLQTQTESFVNHTIIAGKSGSGKSNALEYLARNMVGRWKIIDLYDSGRFENFLYDVPEINTELNARLFHLTQQRPIGMPCQKIIIMGPFLRYDKSLPNQVELRSFNGEDLTLEDMWFLLGKSDAVRGTLAFIEDHEGNLTFQQMSQFLESPKAISYVNRRFLHPGTFYAIKRQISRWRRSGIFSDHYDKINFKEICEDVSTITSFSTVLCEPELEPIAYGLILKMLFELKRRGRIKPRIGILIRELSNFMLPQFAFPRHVLLRIIREGRDYGIDILADTQRPKDLTPIFRRQFGYYIQMKADFEDAMTMLEIQEVPRQYLHKVPHFGVGEAIVATGVRFDYPLLFPPTPHLHKKPGLNVMNMLAERSGGWHEYEYYEAEGSQVDNVPEPEPETKTETLDKVRKHLYTKAK